MKILANFINLFYPKICEACGINLQTKEEIICLKCRYEIPKTNYLHIKDNEVEHIFWGRVFVQHASSFYYFVKESRYQKLIHKLKYHGKKEIGYELGKIFGADLIKSDFYKNIDIVVPVPLHPKREKKRGYNQAEWIAMGIAESMKIKIDSRNLYRAIETETQTKKNRFDRFKNVDNVFQIKNPNIFKNKHLLLVDDVVTTGSTFEACANELLKVENVKVSIVALASAPIV